MKKYITYWKINKILKSIQKNSWYKDWIILEIEIKELINLWFLELNNPDITWIFNDCKITIEWEKFLNSYNWCKKVEYFFQDFPFFWAIIIWIIWGTIWWLISVLFPKK